MPFWKKKQTLPLRRPQSDIAEQGVVFRRSRTLTGTASSNVSVINESRSQLKSPRLKEHELRKHRRLLVGGFLGLMMLSGGCVWLLDQYIVGITFQSAVSTVTPLDSSRYQKAVNDYLDSRPLERFRFILKPEALNDYLQTKVPEVQEVMVTGASGLVATDAVVTLRQPVAVWQVNTTKYYVDASGVTYQKNYYSEPQVSVNDQSGVTPQSTELIASSRLLRFLGQLVSGVNASSVGTVTSVTIPAGTLRELDIILTTHPYRIKTHMDREAVGQVADIVSAVTYMDSRQIVPEYIDVRVEGKAFYR